MNEHIFPLEVIEQALKAAVSGWHEAFNNKSDSESCWLAAIEAALAVPFFGAQKPVAWVEVIDSREGPYHFHGMELLTKGKHHLYSTPQPQPAPSVPDGVYVPGLWRCPKCEFQLVQSNLNVQSGTVTARDNSGDKCPNCDGPLWRVTYRDAYTELMQRFESYIEENRIHDGWQLVPVDLTEEMYDVALDINPNFELDEICCLWDDMLAAAPQSAPSMSNEDYLSSIACTETEEMLIANSRFIHYYYNLDSDRSHALMEAINSVLEGRRRQRAKALNIPLEVHVIEKATDQQAEGGE